MLSTLWVAQSNLYNAIIWQSIQTEARGNVKFQQDTQDIGSQSSSPYDAEIRDLANRLKLGKLQSS
ncbi:hypothetical protein KDW_44600 [Dictyobacter vulcani]|uniref:Uncharacterized protein n=1 Tax=Dictyobacter vulcani TaxID=2607529 RepID=A0A5J4KKJ9_9CHLR|nr:hypothetical protein KDW_44600 [Dictyobacter vulcani]